MEAPELRPGSFWYLLKRRFFNKDAESLLLERLGVRGVEWAMSVNEARPGWLGNASEALDQWLVDDLVLPGRKCSYPSLEEESDSDDELKRQLLRTQQFTRMKNSFGMGLVLGAGLYREMEAIREPTMMEPFFLEVQLEDAVGLLEREDVSEPLMRMSLVNGFAKLIEELITDYWRCNPLSYHLAPIARGHGFFKYGYPPMSEERMLSAKRCMLLAGLIASGLRVPEPQDEEALAEEDQERTCEEAQCSASDAPVALELHKLSDEALESLMDQVHLREFIHQELRYRLRSDRLGRMLAYLERASKDEHEDNGAAGDE
jgi:hypothetical protein